MPTYITPAALGQLRIGNAVIIDGVTVAADHCPIRGALRQPMFLLGEEHLQALADGALVEMVPETGGEPWLLIPKDLDPPPEAKQP